MNQLQNKYVTNCWNQQPDLPSPRILDASALASEPKPISLTFVDLGIQEQQQQKQQQQDWLNEAVDPNEHSIHNIKSENTEKNDPGVYFTN